MAIDPSVRARVVTAALVRSARHADRGVAVALIAVHDEDEQVEVAIRSLKAQESPPELHDEDGVRVVNVDSMPVPSFLSEAMRRLREGIGVGVHLPGMFVGIEKDGYTHS